jgi:hypothetical protein
MNLDCADCGSSVRLMSIRARGTGHAACFGGFCIELVKIGQEHETLCVSCFKKWLEARAYRRILLSRETFALSARRIGLSSRGLKKHIVRSIERARLEVSRKHGAHTKCLDEGRRQLWKEALEKNPWLCTVMSVAGAGLVSAGVIAYMFGKKKAA